MSEPHDSDLPYDDSIYRIYINPHTNVTELSCIGIEVDRMHNVYWVFRDPVDVPWLADYIT